jgi:hypothetical protein
VGVTIIQDGKRYNQSEFAAKRKVDIAEENRARIAALLAGINKVFTSAEKLNGIIEDATSCGLVICNTKNVVVSKFKDEWGMDTVAYITDAQEPRRRTALFETVKTRFTVRPAR